MEILSERVMQDGGISLPLRLPGGRHIRWVMRVPTYASLLNIGRMYLKLGVRYDEVKEYDFEQKVELITRHGVSVSRMVAYTLCRGWISRRLARQQQSLTPEALAFMADRVEGNLLAARQEIDKLALLHPPGELDLAALQAAVERAACALGARIEEPRVLHLERIQGGRGVVEDRSIQSLEQGGIQGVAKLLDLRQQSAAPQVFHQVGVRISEAFSQQGIKVAAGGGGRCAGLGGVATSAAGGID